MVSQCVVAGKLACNFRPWSLQVLTILQRLNLRVALYIISFHNHENLIEDAKINKLLGDKDNLFLFDSFVKTEMTSWCVFISPPQLSGGVLCYTLRNF